MAEEKMNQNGAAGEACTDTGQPETSAAAGQEAEKAAVRAAMPAHAAPAAGDAIPNRGELVAAISVALAEELGKDVKAIRIHSIKRV